MRIKNKDKNKVKNYSNFNVDTLKLLIAQEDVQNKIKNLRLAVGMPDGGFQSEKEFLSWYHPILNKYMDGNKEAVEIMRALYDGINKIRNDYGLTKDFFSPLWSYVGFNEMVIRISGNIEISMTYPEKNEPLVVTIEIFRKPSTRELEEIRSIVKEWSGRYLPSHRKIKTSAKMDIDKYLKIFSLMKKRGIHKEKIYDSQYLEIMRKKYDEGKITKKQFLEVERLHKHAVKIKKVKITSKTIAKKEFGTSNAHQKVRTINTRVKKELKRRFKKV